MGFANDARTVAFVYARNLEQNLDFYVDQLGFDITGRDDFGAFVAGAGALIRMTPMPDHQPGPHPVLGWHVSDIAATIGALRAMGVEFTKYDGMGQDPDGIWTAPDGKAKIAWFADAEGNVLSLSQS